MAKRTRIDSFAIALITASIVLVLAGCGSAPPPPPPPPVSDAVYELPQTMTYNSAAQRYLVHFGGKLPYQYPSACKDEIFSFSDHPQQPATLDVWIRDTAGLQPGDRFQYILVFDRPGGFTEEAFTLVAFNPLGGPPRAYSYSYSILTNSPDPNLLWQHPGVPIEGDYSIVTDRDMTVTLKFTLRKTVSGAPGPPCGLPY